MGTMAHKITMLSPQPGAAAKLQPPVKDKKMAKIDEAAQEFEAMYMTEMLRPMFEGIEVDPNFGGGKGEEVFNGMMLEQYGKIMAKHGGIGLAKYVKDEMIRLQEGKK
jgi:flagellar protein FlgJ